MVERLSVDYQLLTIGHWFESSWRDSHCLFSLVVKRSLCKRKIVGSIPTGGKFSTFKTCRSLFHRFIRLCLQHSNKLFALSFQIETFPLLFYAVSFLFYVITIQHAMFIQFEMNLEFGRRRCYKKHVFVCIILIDLPFPLRYDTSHRFYYAYTKRKGVLSPKSFCFFCMSGMGFLLLNHSHYLTREVIAWGTCEQ